MCIGLLHHQHCPPEWLLLFFSCSVVSSSLQLHGLHHARLPCPSPSPRVCSNSSPLSWWCHPTHLILCNPLLLPPSIFPSIRVFSNESALLIRWPKYWNFSFSIQAVLPMKISGLISFRVDFFFYLFAIQGTLKSLLQHHSLKASILCVPEWYICYIWWAYINTSLLSKAHSLNMVHSWYCTFCGFKQV